MGKLSPPPYTTCAVTTGMFLAVQMTCVANGLPTLVCTMCCFKKGISPHSSCLNSLYLFPVAEVSLKEKSPGPTALKEEISLSNTAASERVLVC